MALTAADKMLTRVNSLHQSAAGSILRSGAALSTIGRLPARCDGPRSGQQHGDRRMLENVLRHATQNHARHTAFAMRTQRDAVRLLPSGCVEYDFRGWLDGFD